MVVDIDVTGVVGQLEALVPISRECRAGDVALEMLSVMRSGWWITDRTLYSTNQAVSSHWFNIASLFH